MDLWQFTSDLIQKSVLGIGLFYSGKKEEQYENLQAQNRILQKQLQVGAKPALSWNALRQWLCGKDK